MNEDGMPALDIKMKDEFKNKIFKKNDDKYDEKMLLYMVDFITRALLFSWKIDKKNLKIISLNIRLTDSRRISSNEFKIY